MSSSVRNEEIKIAKKLLFNQTASAVSSISDRTSTPSSPLVDARHASDTDLQRLLPAFLLKKFPRTSPELEPKSSADE